jgi:3-dehydroquinate dehydratase
VSHREVCTREPATARSRTGTLTKRRDEQPDMGFRNLPHPFVCCVLIDDPTPDGVLRTMKLAEYEGADAFDLELQSLEPACRTPGALRALFEQATRPIFTVYRRYTLEGSSFVYAEADEEARMRAQLDLIEVGSMGFDMELDTFDPQPRPRLDTDEFKRRMYDRASPACEISYAPRAVERQLQIIEEAHRRGGEVLASSHALVRLTPERALAIGRLAEERGADAVKIVQFCANDTDVVEALASTVRLKHELRIPFVLMAMGEYGKLVRAMSPLLGSMLVFARQDYTPGSFLDQPPVRAMRAVLSNVDFRISQRASWFLPPELREDDA